MTYVEVIVAPHGKFAILAVTRNLSHSTIATISITNDVFLYFGEQFQGSRPISSVLYAEC